MVKQIVRDVFFLSRKSEPATRADLQVAVDLMDTLKANRERCVGMAANMRGQRAKRPCLHGHLATAAALSAEHEVIGVNKCIIIVNMGLTDVVMFNSKILKQSGPYETEEGCLSLDGVRKTTRYQNIEVEYFDMRWKKQKMKLSGWTAQIAQHEIDHLSGRVI